MPSLLLLKSFQLSALGGGGGGLRYCSSSPASAPRVWMFTWRCTPDMIETRDMVPPESPRRIMKKHPTKSTDKNTLPRPGAGVQSEQMIPSFGSLISQVRPEQREAFFWALEMRPRDVHCHGNLEQGLTSQFVWTLKEIKLLSNILKPSSSFGTPGIKQTLTNSC